MLRKEQIRSIADQVLAYCEADAAELVVSSKTSDLTRFYKNSVHQNVEERETRVHLRLWDDYREGMASTNLMDESSLRDLVARAAEVAKVGPRQDALPSFSLQSAADTVDSVDPAIVDQSPEARAEAVGAVCKEAAAQGTHAYGAYLVEHKQVGVANSVGLFNYHDVTLADFQTVVRSNGSSGWAQASNWQLDQVPVQALGEEAIRKAVDGIDLEPSQPASMTVVLDPYATADLIYMLSMPGMSGRAVAEGRSWISDRLGQQAMHESVSIWDDGYDLHGVPQPFDFEGTPKQKLDIVREGVVMGAAHDRATAAYQDTQSTGHALSPDFQPMVRFFSPLPTNLFMAPGSASTEDLIRSTKSGVYITRFHYTRHVHPRDCVVTGMTRDGVFVIDDGQLIKPVKDLRFTQSYVEALNNVEAIGSEVRVIVDDFLNVAISAPAIKIADFRFTGSTV